MPAEDDASELLMMTVAVSVTVGARHREVVKIADAVVNRGLRV